MSCPSPWLHVRKSSRKWGVPNCTILWDSHIQHEDAQVKGLLLSTIAWAKTTSVFIPCEPYFAKFLLTHSKLLWTRTLYTFIPYITSNMSNTYEKYHSIKKYKVACTCWVVYQVTIIILQVVFKWRMHKYYPDHWMSQNQKDSALCYRHVSKKWQCYFFNCATMSKINDLLTYLFTIAKVKHPPFKSLLKAGTIIEFIISYNSEHIFSVRRLRKDLSQVRILFWPSNSWVGPFSVSWRCTISIGVIIWRFFFVGRKGNMYS